MANCHVESILEFGGQPISREWTAFLLRPTLRRVPSLISCYNSEPTVNCIRRLSGCWTHLTICSSVYLDVFIHLSTSKRDELQRFFKFSSEDFSGSPSLSAKQKRSHHLINYPDLDHPLLFFKQLRYELYSGNTVLFCRHIELCLLQMNQDMVNPFSVLTLYNLPFAYLDVNHSISKVQRE